MSLFGEEMIPTTETRKQKRYVCSIYFGEYFRLLHRLNEERRNDLWRRGTLGGYSLAPEEYLCPKNAILVKGAKYDTMGTHM